MATGSNTTTTSLELGDAVVWRENEDFRFGEVYRIEYFDTTDDFNIEGVYVAVESKDGKPRSTMGTTNPDLLYKTAFVSHEINYMSCGT